MPAWTGVVCIFAVAITGTLVVDANDDVTRLSAGQVKLFTGSPSTTFRVSVEGSTLALLAYLDIAALGSGLARARKRFQCLAAVKNSANNLLG